MTSRGHKYRLGQEAIFTPGDDFATRVPTRCRITRLLPREATEYQYHVEFEPDGQQRHAWEKQLTVAPVM
jgi:hypothetical protein